MKDRYGAVFQFDRDGQIETRGFHWMVIAGENDRFVTLPIKLRGSILFGNDSSMEQFTPLWDIDPEAYGFRPSLSGLYLPCVR